MVSLCLLLFMLFLSYFTYICFNVYGAFLPYVNVRVPGAINAVKIGKSLQGKDYRFNLTNKNNNCPPLFFFFPTKDTRRS